MTPRCTYEAVPGLRCRRGAKSPGGLCRGHERERKAYETSLAFAARDEAEAARRAAEDLEDTIAYNEVQIDRARRIVRSLVRVPR